MPVFGSGAILQTTQNAEYSATRLAQDTVRFRTCGIAIANKTIFKLSLPRRYLSSGRIVSMPLIIRPDTTGLILCENCPNSLEGTCGLITYKIEDPCATLQQLQILWYVPLDVNLYSCQVNIRIGVESASEDVFQNMYKSSNGYESMYNAAEAPHVLTYDNYEVDLLMGSNGKAPLTVCLKNRPT